MTSASSARCSTGSANTVRAGAPRVANSRPRAPAVPRRRSRRRPKRKRAEPGDRSSAKREKPGAKARLRCLRRSQGDARGELFDLLVERVLLEVRVVFHLLDALRHGLLIAEREVTRDGLARF